MRKSKAAKIRVLLADDHPIVRDGVRSSLMTHDHLDVVGEASDGTEVLRKIKELSPDVVLMDISMPTMSGLEVMRQLQKSGAKVKVIMLTMHDSKEYIRQIVRSGAQGYVLKNIHPTDLVRAIEAVYAGEAYFSPAVSRVILNDYRKDEGERTRRSRGRLSSREREVLTMIAEGYTNKEIASRLFVTVRTIETHRERIMRKLNIHNAAGLTKYAIAQGIVKAE